MARAATSMAETAREDASTGKATMGQEGRDGRRFDGRRRRFDNNKNGRRDNRGKDSKGAHESNFKPYFRESN